MHSDPPDAGAELLRLAECAKEPIRTPGRIQSHGILLAVDPATTAIVVASENASEWLGRPVSDLCNPTLDWCTRTRANVDPFRMELDGVPYEAVIHQLPDRVLCEFEPSIASLEYARTSVTTALQRLANLTDQDALRAATVEEVRAITGFDRVMMYRFHQDEHGEIVAESAAPDMERSLGLHFPASDIPAQARELYLTKFSRAIVSTTDPGIPILAAEDDAAQIDLAPAELRAVSPHHLQFMRNMGQSSTVSLSMVHEGRLIGMITCAHRTERRMPVLLRRALEVMTTQVTLQLTGLAALARLERELQVRDRRANLLAPLTASGDVLGTLLGGRSTVLDLVPADGVIVKIDGAVRGAGSVPAGDPQALLDAVGDEELVTHMLRETHPQLAALMPEFAGVLVIPLGNPGDKVVFFRHEVVREVRWLGEQSDKNRDSLLSPRRSFSEWKQSVAGAAQPWNDAARDAVALGAELSDVLARREAARLAELAVVDSLTGLSNRRRLMSELQRSVDAAATDVDAAATDAVLFVDLDRFKQINDEHGHEVGDAVLIVIAERLRASSRDGDLVARLGGDEFVIVSRDLHGPDAEALAARIVSVVEEPIHVDGRLLRVRASCGVALIGEAATAAEVLRAADTRMFTAKRARRSSSTRR